VCRGGGVEVHLVLLSLVIPQRNAVSLRVAIAPLQHPGIGHMRGCHCCYQPKSLCKDLSNSQAFLCMQKLNIITGCLMWHLCLQKTAYQDCHTFDPISATLARGHVGLVYHCSHLNSGNYVHHPLEPFLVCLQCSPPALTEVSWRGPALFSLPFCYRLIL